MANKLTAFLLLITSRVAFRDWLAARGWYLPTVKFVIQSWLRRNNATRALSALQDARMNFMITNEQYLSLKRKYDL